MRLFDGTVRSRVSKSSPPESLPPAVVEAVAAADEAGLHYVNDATPGISRSRAGQGFRYTKPDGTAVTDPKTIARIKHLAIPPAWTEVWICPLANGHIQATGRDG